MLPGRMYLDDVDVRYRALVDVAGALTSHSDHTDLLRSLRGHLEPIVQFTFLSVWLWIATRIASRWRSSSRRDSPAARLVGESYPAAGTYPGQAVQTGHPVYVSQVDPGGPFPSQVLIEHGTQSYCAVPLVTAHGTIGTLNFGSLDRDAYTAEDIELMSRVGALVAVALENARSVETIRDQQAALRRERDQLDLLLDVTNAIVTQLDTRALFLARGAGAASGCCSAEFAALTLYDPEARVLRQHVCQGPPELRRHRSPMVTGDTARRVARRPRLPTRRAAHLLARRDLLRFPETRRLSIRRALGLLGAAAHAARPDRHAGPRRRSIATRFRRRCSAC